ncbi:MAG: RluA family pseudouridine synthase [Dehalococcoidia bacterium]
MRELEARDSGRRLDQWLADTVPELSRSYAKQLIQAGRILVSGRAVRPSYHVQAGDTIRADVPPAVPSLLVPDPLHLTILYEDGDMLVIDKPAGIAVHPGPGHPRHTIVNALIARYPQLPGINGTQRPGIVHRLDLDTTGLLMVAKTDRGQQSLSAQLAARTVHKGYIALVTGKLTQKQGRIEAPVGRDPIRRERMAVLPNGRSASTRFVTLERLRGYTLVLAMPETGRMHQIRVHFAALGHALAGDPLYGGDRLLLSRQFLHALLLRFARPADGETVAVRSMLPEDLRIPLGMLRRESRQPPSSIDAWLEGLLTLAQQWFDGEVQPAAVIVQPPRTKVEKRAPAGIGPPATLNLEL